MQCNTRAWGALIGEKCPCLRAKPPSEARQARRRTHREPRGQRSDSICKFAPTGDPPMSLAPQREISARSTTLGSCGSRHNRSNQTDSTRLDKSSRVHCRSNEIRQTWLGFDGLSCQVQIATQIAFDVILIRPVDLRVHMVACGGRVRAPRLQRTGQAQAASDELRTLA